MSFRCSRALAALLVCVAPVGPVLAAAGEGPRRPSFLFVFTDDQRWDALGVVQREQGDRARFPWFETPNMDRLAAGGVRFRNAFVVNALCSPSRACFLTGRYSHHNGITNNRTPFPADAVTHASLLRAAGYLTGYVGKWHMGNQTGKRPGFDYSASFIAHARYIDAPFEVDGTTTATNGWVDDVSTDFALEFLRRDAVRSGEKPFLLVVGYKSPHAPFEPPERLRERFAGALARAPANGASLPPFPRARRAAPAGPESAAGQVGVNLNYFRCIAGVDENLGRLLAALEELGLARSTMVVYSSDNGFYLGEHGLLDKRSAYEESIRIPLLVRYPPFGPGGAVADELALNIDLAPTFLDLAGVPVPGAMQGRSWRPLLDRAARGVAGTAVEWRQAFFYEYFFERGFFTPTVTAVRTAGAKLIKYPGHDDWTELFDLAADPHETRNLAREAAAAGLRSQLEAELARQAAGVGFRVPENTDREEDAAAAARRRAEVVLDYDLAAAGGDRVTDASGRGNDGTAKGVAAPVDAGGRKARRFDGKGAIEVPRSPSLDPSLGPWTVQVVVKAERPGGIILARGGASQGYALYLEGGRPRFGVRADGRLQSVAADGEITGKWAHLAGVITADRKLVLYVNGEPAGEGALDAFIGRDPNDGLQIGADAGSAVVPYGERAGLTGWVASVKIFSGERSAADIRLDAAAPPAGGR